MLTSQRIHLNQTKTENSFISEQDPQKNVSF